MFDKYNKEEKFHYIFVVDKVIINLPPICFQKSFCQMPMALHIIANNRNLWLDGLKAHFYSSKKIFKFLDIDSTESEMKRLTVDWYQTDSILIADWHTINSCWQQTHRRLTAADSKLISYWQQTDRRLTAADSRLTED